MKNPLLAVLKIFTNLLKDLEVEVRIDGKLNSRIEGFDYLGFNILNRKNGEVIDAYVSITNVQQVEIKHKKITHKISINLLEEYICKLLEIQQNNWEYFNLVDHTEKLLFPNY